jgi:pyridoxine 5-phosphate synthase
MTQLAIDLSPAVILRQAGRAAAPDPVHLAVAAELGGADAVALHVRENRDLITDRDVRMLRRTLTVPLFLRTACTPEMTGLALELKPALVTLVTEKPQSLAVGAVDIVVYRDAVAEAVATLQSSGLPVCVAVAPDIEHVKIAHRIGAAAVEIDTGDFARATAGLRERLAATIADSVSYAAKLKVAVHASGGLDYQGLKRLAGLRNIDWFRLGRSVVARALMTGMKTAVADFQQLLRCPPAAP